MRVMLRATMDSDKANEVLAGGKMPELLKETMDRIHPEAAYFMPDGGSRTCMLIFDMQDSSQLPPIAEPFFQALNAKVEFLPVMNLEDLQKGLATLDRS